MPDYAQMGDENEPIGAPEEEETPEALEAPEEGMPDDGFGEVDEQSEQINKLDIADDAKKLISGYVGSGDMGQAFSALLGAVIQMSEEPMGEEDPMEEPIEELPGEDEEEDDMGEMDEIAKDVPEDLY